MGRRLILVLLAASIAIPATAAAGARPWKTHTVKSAGFALEAPPTWVDLTSAAPQALKELLRQDPSLAPLLAQVKASKLVKLLCSEPTGRANVNVVSIAVGSSTLQDFTEANVAQIKASTLVRGPVAESSTTLPAGPAALVRYQEVIGTSPKVNTIQYYFVHAGKGYVVTFTTRPSLRAAYSATFRRIIRSYHFLKTGLTS